MSRSSELFSRAKGLIPGGVNSPVRSFKHVGVGPIYFDRGEGPYLVDVDGNKYIDFCLAFGPHILGHCPPPVVEALHAQVDRATTFGACHAKEVDLAEWVLKAYPFLDQIRMLNSGTEAVMTAVRLARGFTGRSKVVQFEGCYHGHSDGFLAKAGSGVAFLAESSSQGVPPSIVSETLVANLQDLVGLERLFSQYPDQIAAVLLEPVPANNGLWVPSRDHLSAVMDMAKAHGALVIFDEVICGFRLGLSGASGMFDLQPDLVTLGKILGGGLPVAAVAGKKAIMERLAPVGSVYQAGTLSGNPLGTAAGCAVMETLFAENPYPVLAERTQWFASRIEALLAGRAKVRSVASLFWICFGDPGEAFPPVITAESHANYAEFFRRALGKGLYLPPSPYEVGFLSTAHSPMVLEQALERLAECVD